MSSRKKAFSLVELSVVLVVISVLTSGVLTILTKHSEDSKLKITEKRMEIIEKSIEKFVIENNRLPCPADGTTVIVGEAFFGFEKRSSSKPVLCDSNFTFNDIHAGVVPVLSLGLSKEYMFDGWKRRFSYVVDGNLVNSEDTDVTCSKDSSSECFKFSEGGKIKIKDASSRLITEAAAYVIISHGRNGHGGYKRFGSNTRLGSSSDADEKSNAGDDIGSFNDEFVQKSVDNSFDDIVSYKMRSQIVHNASMISGHICDSAMEVYNDSFLGNKPDNSICKNAKNEKLCDEMAKKINSICAY